MKRSLSLSNRLLWVGIVAVLLLFGLLLVLAPATGLRTSGSTYSRAPEGYLGWYRSMQAAGLPVQRWRRPLEDLLDDSPEEPQTLLRVYPGLTDIYRFWNRDWTRQWLAAGNHLVLVGIEAPVTEARFTTRQDSPYGPVVIKTRRREPLLGGDRRVLGDDYGAIVWHPSELEVPEQVWAVSTPHLAANAYLDEPGNYALLADLVRQTGGPIWVDEYLHGYKAADVVVAEVVNSWGEYLAQTPVKVALIQIAILLALVLLSQNRRLGNLTPLKAPTVDNSQAYIEALAAVLHKATSHAFLVDMIAKAERTSLQRALGFSDSGTDEAAVKAAWVDQTGQPEDRLTPLLQPPSQTSANDKTLKEWLRQLRLIRQTPLR